MGTFTILKLVSGVAPKDHIDMHTLKVSKLATIQLDSGEAVQGICLTIACICCELYFLSFYGVQGNFKNTIRRLLELN